MKTFLFLFAVLIAATASANKTSEWVLVNIPVACIRDGRSHASEMTSQAVMGTPMLVLEDDGGEWLHLEGPDGYTGYMNVSSVVRMSDRRMDEWRSSPRLVTTSMSEVKVLTDTFSGSCRNVVTELVNGAIVSGEKNSGIYTHVTLPDGRAGWVESSALAPIEDWASQAFDAQAILDRCYYMMGTPYLWGACSTKSVDCSGLVRVAYYANGILTRRDAREQIDIGYHIAPADTVSLLPADLLFFSNEPDGRISHVAIYDHNRVYIHSSGRVKTNKMHSDDPDFSNRVYRGASRIAGMIPSDGIMQIIAHPWYFRSDI